MYKELIILIISLLNVLNINGFNIINKSIKSKSSVRSIRSISMVAGSGGQDEMKEFIDDAILKQDYRTAFKYLYSHPNYKLDRDQRISLLNNVDEMIPLGYSVDRFYANLKNDGSLKSFGVMDHNYPVIDANIKEFEMIFSQNPTALAEATELPPEAFNWMMDLGKTENAYKNIDMMSNAMGVVGTVGLGMIGKLLGLDDIIAFGAATAIAGAIAGIESNPEYQKIVSTHIEEAAIKSMQLLSPKDHDHELQRQAGVFLVAYLVGSPIVSCDMNPTFQSASKRVYYYNDAPRIDVRDKAEGTITNAPYADTQGLDMDGLLRLAVTAMAPAAVDAINGRPIRISKFVRMLFALIYQKIADPAVCQIKPDQLPQRLLPTLALYGFVQAVLVLKESGVALGAATTKLKAGVGIGDMVEAIEYCLDSPHPALRRQSMKREVENHKIKSTLAPSRVLATIIRARELSRDIAQEEEDIELIPGTSRIYTKEELVLPPEPNEWEIREVAKQVMNNKYQADLSKIGRVSPRTRQEVNELSQQVTAALIKYREMKNMEDNSIRSSKSEGETEEEIQKKFAEHIAAQHKRAKLATHNLRTSVGLGDDAAKWMTEGNAFIQPYGLSELIAELRSVKDTLEKVGVIGNLIWQNQILPKVHDMTGKKVSDAIDSAWASKTQSNMGNPNSTPRARDSAHRDALHRIKKLRELDELLIESTGERFMGSVPVPDGASYWNEEELTLPTVMKPMTLLEEHDGVEERNLEEETNSKLKRLNLVEARLNDILTNKSSKSSTVGSVSKKDSKTA